MFPTPSCPLRQAWAGRALALEFLCVGGRPGRWAGVGLARWCARPYLLGVGRKMLFHKARSVSRQLASGTGFVAFLPGQEPPIHNRRSPTHWAPAPPLQLVASPGQGSPGGAKQGSPGQQFQEGRPGREQRACGVGAVADGLEPCLGRRLLAGWIRATSEAALIGEAVTAWGAWGAPSLPAWRSLVLASPPWGLALLLWPSGLCGLSPGHRAAASRPQPFLGLRPPEPSVPPSC